MSPELASLQADGVCLLLDVAGPRPPRVLHWGAPLSTADGIGLHRRRSDDQPPTDDAPGLPSSTVAALPDLDVLGPGSSLLALPDTGWPGLPALSGFGSGGPPFARLRLSEPVTVQGNSLTVRCADEQAGLAVLSEVVMDRHGVLRVRHTVTNTGEQDWQLAGLVAMLPVPQTVTELLDFTGRWCRERAPQRGQLRFGSNLRQSRRGRSGFDSAGLLLAGTESFGFRHGEVYAMQVAWSGNSQAFAERTVGSGTLLGGGELLEPGELVLAPGQSYAAPWVWFSYSASGLDGISAGLHAALRDRSHHPSGPRPLTFNTWEALYFDLDLDQLLVLARLAAQVGAERFVLDDGWFLGRRDDLSGLGDWTVDPKLWPDGLGPLIEQVRGLGMQFGLWVEPEMVSPDSELHRAHPDWVLAGSGRLPAEHRNQQVLDVANPAAYDYLLERLDTLLTDHGIDYLKWDHNRELVEPVHAGRPGCHAQTVALYRLLDELRRRHPALEIESCASGGARADLGILEHTDRVWASDCADPVERQAIQRWTTLTLAPELVGVHVGAPVAHTTGRATDLSLRAATALFGHAGIEWDLREADPGELAQLSDWAAAYRRLRPVLHGGETVRADPVPGLPLLHGVVSADRRRAVYCYLCLSTIEYESGCRIRLIGLDPELRYTVGAVPELLLPMTRQPLPAWLDEPDRPISGALLDRLGLPFVDLQPQQALVIEVSAVN